MQQCKFLSKKELRLTLNISKSTLSNYLNIIYYNELVALGYSKKNRLLSPNIIKYLKNKLDFD